METADIALMADDLSKLPDTIRLARRANRIIMQNVTVSLIVIAALVIAAVTGAFTLTQGVLINEVFALVIIANGLRLLRGSKQSDTPVVTPATSTASTVATPAACADDACGCAPAAQSTLPVVEAPSCSTDGACGCAPVVEAPTCSTDSGCGCSATPPTIEPAVSDRRSGT